MIIDEVQLFRGLSPDFMEEVAAAAEEKTYAADQVIFNRGDPAVELYILEEGRINLYVKEGATMNFTVDAPGEVFGWSALVEPNVYTASAECYEDSKIVKIDGTRLEHIFERHPKEAYLVMKRLAGVVAQRLVNSYEEHLRSRSVVDTPSYG